MPYVLPQYTATFSNGRCVETSFTPGGYEPSQHTPGPWTLSDDDSPLLYGTGGPYIAQVFSRTEADTGTLRPNYAADAAVIAAAPDLLAALQGLLQGIIRHEVKEEYLKHYPEVAAARAAIAKATGKTA